MTKKSKSFGGLQRSEPEFNPDYTTTKKELRRIAMLAGIFFALLIALYFILPLIQK